ncbi:hypothetical protein BDV06DRAFT_231095 [Aspergillus oleicola]
MSSKPKLAILDDYQNIAPPHFTHLQDRISITSFPQTLDPRIPTQQNELIQRLQDYDIILAMRERTPFTASTISQLPNLKLFLTTGQRNRALDTEYCRERGIPVAGTESRGGGGKGTPSTVQHTWALILALARHVARDDASIKRSDGGEKWQGSLGMSLSGKTLGLVGLGKLGSAVARVAVLGFGMDVCAWSTNLSQEKADEAAVGVGLEKGDIQVVAEKQELFKNSHVVSVHYVLSDRSKGIVGGPELASMKNNALLINTSRGPLIDESALLDVLNKGGIGGAALDVFDPEPLPIDSPWRTTKWGVDGRSEVVLTPHMGYGDEQIHGCSFPPFFLLAHTLLNHLYSSSITAKMPIAVQEPVSASTQQLSATTKPPSHPGLIRVSYNPGSFASAAYNDSPTTFPPGSLFTKITTATPSKKAYSSVQTSRNTHIELNSDLLYCNHSCEPSLVFDMGKMEVRVVDGRPLKKGDALTFFYPSSEWEMDQVFECNCGTKSCRGVISGAGNMKREDLEGYWLNQHIEELLRERDGQ